MKCFRKYYHYTNCVTYLWINKHCISIHILSECRCINQYLKYFSLFLLWISILHRLNSVSLLRSLLILVPVTDDYIPKSSSLCAGALPPSRLCYRATLDMLHWLARPLLWWIKQVAWAAVVTCRWSEHLPKCQHGTLPDYHT